MVSLAGKRCYEGVPFWLARTLGAGEPVMFPAPGPLLPEAAAGYPAVPYQEKESKSGTHGIQASELDRWRASGPSRCTVVVDGSASKRCSVAGSNSPKRQRDGVRPSRHIVNAGNDQRPLP